MSKKGKEIFRTVYVCLLAICIPACLIVAGYQAQRYKTLEQEVLNLEEEQSEYIEKNKKLITDISVLSSADRIEDMAVNKLGMRQAETDEIVRVEMKGAKNEQ